MLDSEQMRRETTSNTWKGRITNPIRHLLVWPLVAPFFQAAYKENDALLEGRYSPHKDLDSLRKDLDSLRKGLDSLHKGRLDSLHKDLDSLHKDPDSLHKDQVALRYRLASIEATLSDAREAMAEQWKLAANLVVVSQPYGCFLVHRGDVISDALADGMFWDEHLKAVIENCANSDGVAIDAGAYIGFHSVFMSRNFKTVHSFEPQRHIYHLLRANLALNGCNNVVGHNQALYDHACQLRIAADDKQEIPIVRKGTRIDYDAIPNAGALAFELADADSPEAVPAITIDSLDLQNVAFIKIDAQGADFGIISGARRTIERWRPVIAFELERSLSSQHQTKPEDVAQFFASLDYSLEVARSYGDGKQIDYIGRPRCA